MATEKPDRNYDGRELNKWFAIGSLVLLVVTLLMVGDDYSRQWKDFQRQFHRQETTRTKREIRDAQKALNSADMKKLQAELKQALDEINKQKSEHDKALKNLSKIDADFYGKDLDYRFAKADYDSKKYETEIKVEHLRAHKKLKEAEAAQAELDAVKKRMDKTKLALEAVTAKQDVAKAEVAKLAGRVEDIEARRRRWKTTRDRLKKLETVEPGFVSWLVNAPMLDFMAPPPGPAGGASEAETRHQLHGDPRVDRCMTCHTVIDKPGYEKGAQPFRTHPNLKLYVDPQSKHPIESFGCTACHGGRDRGTSFVNTAHTPDNEKQAKEWK